jgi:hypothetical protein
MMNAGEADPAAEPSELVGGNVNEAVAKLNATGTAPFLDGAGFIHGMSSAVRVARSQVLA